jgi:transposase
MGPGSLAAYCRIRSYLISARNHGLPAIEAIHTALLARPWLPDLAPA